MVKTAINWKNFAILMLMGMMVHTSVIAMDHRSSSSSSREDAGDIGFNAATMLDRTHPSGLNLQEIVNDQHRRRSMGLGTGFSTDVIGIANSKETLAKLAEQMNQLIKQKNLLEEEQKPKDKKKHQEQLNKLNLQIDTIVGQMKLVNETIKSLKEKVSHVSGVDYNNLENIPKMSEMPRPHK